MGPILTAPEPTWGQSLAEMTPPLLLVSSLTDVVCEWSRRRLSTDSSDVVCASHSSAAVSTHAVAQ